MKSAEQYLHQFDFWILESSPRNHLKMIRNIKFRILPDISRYTCIVVFIIRKRSKGKYFRRKRLWASTIYVEPFVEREDRENKTKCCLSFITFDSHFFYSRMNFYSLHVRWGASGGEGGGIFFVINFLKSVSREKLFSPILATPSSSGALSFVIRKNSRHTLPMSHHSSLIPDFSCFSWNAKIWRRQ